MNRVIAGLCTILFAASSHAGTWTKVPVQVENVIQLAASSDTKAIGLGSIKDQQGNDQMMWLRTSDGDKWAVTQMQTPSPGEILMLTDLRCLGLKCFAVGMGVNPQSMAFLYRILLSKDGGDTWAFPAAPYNGTYQNSRWIIVDEKNVYLAGGAAVVLKSTDGGNTFKWMVPQVGTEKFMKIQDGSFLDVNTGWLVNGYAETDKNTGQITKIEPVGALLKTTDGGSTWSTLFSGESFVPTRIWFASEKVGYMLVEDATRVFMKRTADGGATWSEIVLPPSKAGRSPDSVNGIWVFNELAVVAIASGKVSENVYWYGIYRTKDGINFTMDQEGDGALIALACASQKRCWAGGPKALLFRWDGTDSDVVVVDTGESKPEAVDAVSDIWEPKELPPDAVCMPGELTCVANKVIRCLDDGSGQVVQEECVAPMVCSQGACVEPASNGGTSDGCNANPMGSGIALIVLLMTQVALLRRR